MKKIAVSLIIIIGVIYTVENNRRCHFGPHRLSPWSSTRWQNWARDSIDIVKETFSGKFSQVAEPTACSPFLNNHVLKELTKDDSENMRVAEFGFGKGTMTRDIISILNKRNKPHLDAIEVDATLCKKFKEEYTNEHGSLPEWVHIQNTLVEEWKPKSNKQYNHIICTLPFVVINQEGVTNILEKSRELLDEHGSFSCVSLVGARTCVYISSLVTTALAHLKKLYSSQDLREELNTFNSQTQKINGIDNWMYSNFKVKRTLCLLNITPCWVYTLTPKK